MEQSRRKGGGAKTTRSETVTVRLDPRVRYLAELAARLRRMTLSSYVESAVEESFNLVPVYVAGKDKPSLAHVDRATPLWDEHEPDRFAILATYFADSPYLLTHDEQKLWKLIREVWELNQPAKDFAPAMAAHRLDLNDRLFLRQHWEALKDAASADMPPSTFLARIASEASPAASPVIASKAAKKTTKGARHG